MQSTPQPREFGSTLYGSSHATRLGNTWLEAESLTYPSGGFHRRGYVKLRQNPNNPIVLPYGEFRVVKASIPDTFFSIPARLKYKGKSIRGFISVQDEEFTFMPEAAGK